MPLSLKEEREWGKRLHSQVVAEQRVVKQAKFKDRIQRLAKPLLAAKDRDIDYTFTVVETDEINAFSLAGGYVYVSTALLNFTPNDDELQFVLGHEIGHVDLRHCAKQLAVTARASDILTPVGGQIVGTLHNLMTRPYSQAQEFEADAYGFKAIRSLGKSGEAALVFLERFGQERQEDDHSAGPADNSPFSEAALCAQSHFRTHPPFDQRLARLRKLSKSQE